MKKRKGLKITTYISHCECPKCGNYFPIPRMPHHAREKGHQKDIWCPFCKETVQMTEIRYGDVLYNGCGERIG